MERFAKGHTVVSHPKDPHQGDFEQVLEVLGRDSDDEAAAQTARRTRAGFSGTSFADHLRKALEDAARPVGSFEYIAPEILNRIYGGTSYLPPTQRPVQSEEARIAAELGIGPGLSIDDLHRLRRKFAVGNHPDNARPEERQRATRRMSIANMLIDRALKDRRGQP
jgi:hypothetical protein